MRADAIDRILRDTVKFMETSRKEVFDISEQARTERDCLQRELENISRQIQKHTVKLEGLEDRYQEARKRLVEVSRDFQRYTETDIQTAYEQAMEIQMDIIRHREQIRHLQQSHKDLLKQLRKQERIMEKAEALGSQMTVVYNYLTGDLNQVAHIVESAKNRQLLGFKIILAQEEERKRIAREIHDGPAQSMANMVLRSELTERLLEKEEWSIAQHELRELKKQLRGGLEEIRKIIFSLRPMALDDLGLVPTIQKLLKDIEAQEKIHTVLEVEGPQTRIPPAVEAAVYRVVQEGTANVVKHAFATYLAVRLFFRPDKLEIQIADNGKGFNPKKVLYQAESSGRFGLIGMRERMELLQGRLDIRTAEGEGTTITASVPLNPGEGEIP